MEAAGRVFWITGLSGAGKTTVGRALCDRLRSAGRPVVFLDGDALRAAISEDLGHTTDSRQRSAMRNARLCQLLAGQGNDVVCATISLFHEVQRWNRENIPGYREIYLQVPIDELRRRDTKGIYAGAHRGELRDVVGLDVPAQVPETPDLVLDNHGSLDPTAAVERIWAVCALREKTPAAGPAHGFTTKAETLEALAPLLRHGRVLPQVRLTVGEWRADPAGVLTHIAAVPWSAGSLIVRSSARDEDGVAGSQAGRYDSVLGVAGTTVALTRAIDQVIASFTDGGRPDDQVFVQPMLDSVAMAGVAFSRSPSGGGPYVIVNYDDRTGRTDQVTAGVGDRLETFLCLKSRIDACPPALAPIVTLMGELETLLACNAIDVEFAQGGDGHLYLLQVRPLAVDHHGKAGDAEIEAVLADIARKVELLNRPHPFLHGSRTIFGVMPDWNPAEIIGLRPYPLSLSLYRELITDAIWAYQRDNYGYQNLRSFPLLVSFQGLPYIDVRVSFNSFVPSDVPSELAGRLVNYYIDRLLAEPHLHDKVEFEIIFSCYTLDLPERLQRLREHGFSEQDVQELTCALRRLTNRVIHGETALWRHDRAKVDVLAQRLPMIAGAEIDKISRIYWLIEDCKRYGTLPFAGLARAGFIAVQLLQSFVAVGVLDAEEHATFMASVDTVGSRIGHDFGRLDKAGFLERYGHLRPGTYDILSPRYDEAPDLYFDWSSAEPCQGGSPRFALSIEQLRRIEHMLKEHELDIDVLSLMEFIKAGIEGREYAKFVFTRSLSDALSQIRELGADHGLSAEDCAYLNYDAIRALYSQSGSVSEILRESVARGRESHALTRKLILPPIISAPEQVFAFHLPPSQPNFITRKTITAPVAKVGDPPESFAGRILFVPSADPGFDWIFTRGISGFVTQFGGVNSHMAIRAGELGIPAVIGAGEALFEQWRGAQKLSLDCMNQKVSIIA
ncbi:MAG TPA: adenylyl-sulfate kinase [Aliidongia sp.]|uniref:adenylyl-sulfate kinase n=1 Tax=Aliidongia sp. TaxID=1914230 RepID=UPI002DDCC683|nr:adenylyl-sulfate kinase [Aliidongia sp.]HEV2675054.1 adenylyl-sulfate kinase [Aliidongia sp.]